MIGSCLKGADFATPISHITGEYLGTPRSLHLHVLSSKRLGMILFWCCVQIKFAGMMQYDGELKLPKEYLVPPPKISHVTGEYLAKNGVSTFACSESQKIGHVTFFW